MHEGRMNPKGIPCLYLSDDRDTAMTEVRPWLGLEISVGEFRVARDLNVIDCSGPRRMTKVFGWMMGGREPEPDVRERWTWERISGAFSTPVNPNDTSADYAPTQVLAEAFRNEGYDGILYRSLLGSGANVALFDLGAAQLSNRQVFRVKRLSCEFDKLSEIFAGPGQSFQNMSSR